jgi:hypothetical protein
MLILRTVAEAAAFELLIEGVNPDLWGRYREVLRVDRPHLWRIMIVGP